MIRLTDEELGARAAENERAAKAFAEGCQSTVQIEPHIWASVMRELQDWRAGRRTRDAAEVAPLEVTP